MRACAQDREALSFMGVSVNRIISLTFLVGAMLAGIGGVLTGLYYTQVDFSMGFSLGMKAFTAAVLGGIGNLRGAVLGALILATVQTLGSYYISFTYRDVIAFAVLIIILLFEPSGLLGKPDPSESLRAGSWLDHSAHAPATSGGVPPPPSGRLTSRVPRTAWTACHLRRWS